MLRQPIAGRRYARSQSGMSIVELLVGVTVGLFVVAAAAMLTSTQLTENRKLLLEAQIQQDLRAASDIVARELRRAGAHWAADGSVWCSGCTGTFNNIYSAMTPTVPAVETQYRYRRGSGVTGPFGFKLESARIKSRISDISGWHDLTDSNVLNVTNFSVTPRLVSEPTPGGALPQKMPCPKLCPGGGTACWPTVQVREFVIDIAGTSTSDPSVIRGIRSVVRVRNDELQVNVGGGLVCPA